jgi:hypothetical protein
MTTWYDSTLSWQGAACLRRYVDAVYLESSKTLQTLNLGYGPRGDSDEVREMISLVLRALSRNTSVTKLIIYTLDVGLASVAFRELLTCTQTLQKLQMKGSEKDASFDEVEIATIASGFAHNTTLRDLELESCREAYLVPVLTALQRHPALQKIHLSARFLDLYLSSLSGLEALLRSQDSKVKELVFDNVDTRTVGLYPVIQELERNTTVTNLAIRNSKLSRETLQQLTAVLRRNAALLSLHLTSSVLGSGRDFFSAIPQNINQYS